MFSEGIEEGDFLSWGPVLDFRLLNRLLNDRLDVLWNILLILRRLCSVDISFYLVQRARLNLALYLAHIQAVCAYHLVNHKLLLFGPSAFIPRNYTDLRRCFLFFFLVPFSEKHITIIHHTYTLPFRYRGFLRLDYDWQVFVFWDSILAIQIINLSKRLLDSLHPALSRRHQLLQYRLDTHQGTFSPELLLLQLKLLH